ncbi:MAG: hypothetical protein QOD99_2910 [Chthoniobacter sp.]|nr:hypothetical protein [Chthoniobacter sp.]
MPYIIAQHAEENGHQWAIATAACNLDDQNDALIAETVALVRTAYGESKIMSDAVAMLAAEIAEGVFRTDHLLAAIRSGLPNPGAEGAKPVALTNYRSQTAEMVAKAALAAAYEFEYPASPQEGSPNANQPILGFDGWGLLRRSDDTYVLVLIQVKATDEDASPPREAGNLASECCRVPRDTSALCRALCVLARLLANNPLGPVILRMLETLGGDSLPPMHVAPVIVRGVSLGRMTDLQPIRDVTADIAPATVRGMVVSIGVPLGRFGEIVMEKAREAA